MIDDYQERRIRAALKESPHAEILRQLAQTNSATVTQQKAARQKERGSDAR